MTNPSVDVLVENPVTPVRGTHCIGDLVTNRTDLLSDFTAFQLFIDALIDQHGLTKVGEVYHTFPNGGYTAVVCLSESHLSIHTWPEKNYLTFDVFLSNFKRDNRDVTVSIFQDTVAFFAATIKQETLLDR
jgi:S-adenosylmethionine decarboxylase